MAGQSREVSGTNSGLFFEKSVELFENDIHGKNVANSVEANAQYIIGLNYEKLGNYAKAAASFEKAYAANPKHECADYFLFAQGRCYEKLLKQGAVSAAEAKSIIMMQYSQLISKFPQSSYKSYAESWLGNKGNK
jgi:outer membrane protein assembly factor BamD (BamD/ComL family)